MKQPKHAFLWLLILASLVLSIRVLAIRVPREESNNQVELALEYGDLVKIATAVSMDPLKLVEQAHDWGMTSLVLLDKDLLEAPMNLLQYANNSGLILTPQLSNTLAEQGYDDLNQVLTAVFTLPNQHMLFFSGYEVYGYGDDINTNTIAPIIAMRGATLGMVEFLGEQKGLETYLAAAQVKVIRIHPGYPYDTREELLLAVTDRNVRMIFLKPFKHMDMTPGQELHSLQLWLEQTSGNLQASGFVLGKAEPLTGVPITFTLLLYMTVGIMAASALLLACWLPKLSTPFLLMGSLLASLITGLAYSFGLLPGRDVLDGVALLSSIVFPSLGLTLLLQHSQPEQTRRQRITTAIFGFFGASILTLIGATITNGLRSETIFINAIFSFRGVKVAYFLPLVLTAAYALLRSPHRLYKENFKSLLTGKNLTTGAVIIGLIGFYLVRSGNETSAVSGIERTLRNLLQQFLGVRPRFKEFLTGYPGLALLPFFLSLPWLALALLFLATAGQVSIFNTFMHLHTPYLLSLTRVGWGLLLGIPLALLAYAVTYRFQPTLTTTLQHLEGDHPLD